MGLFQRRPQVGDTIQYYTLGQNKTLLVAGLGNPGKEYGGTRHNIGFECLDAFAKAANFQPWVDKKSLKCTEASATLGDTRVILIKPTTFMNLSGEAVAAVVNFYKIAAGNIIVVHDELDIPFGQIRLRTGGASAGHNGLKSIIQHIGEDFGRVRVGIGPKEPQQIDSADFVLGRFSKDQQAHISELTREVSAILSEAAFGAGSLPQETRSFLL
ncbi:MAG TPA: aminoacyl-tRNA hydrolase [Candidatus Saccharimonadales bacterium]|nr:aminoacyl-tRNA hydrolase [Candidatus Saccharimonadales bacterium]